jgi:hypothetical protein
VIKGIDFSFGSGVTTAQIKGAGFGFVCRYLSGGNSKDITRAELANYKAAGIPVVFVWETDGIMSSSAEGAGHAKAALNQAAGIGAAGSVVFFAADAAQMPDLHGYMSGAMSVLGKGRTGIYGGIGSVSAAFNAGLCAYGWQTAAWSNGQWDNRALLRQVQNGVQLGPAQVDLDEAAFWSSSKVLTAADDFGQWPRPSGKPPAPDPGSQQVPAPAVPAVVTTGGNESLRSFAHYHSMTPQSVIWLTAVQKTGGFGSGQGGYISGGNWDDNMPSGSTWWIGPTP